jgi:hypothetical protein
MTVLRPSHTILSTLFLLLLLSPCSDSHTKNTFSALRCFMLDFWDHNQGECQASSIQLLQQQLEKAALRGHIYNTPPRCLHLIGGGRICLVHSPIGTTLLNSDPYVSSGRIWWWWRQQLQIGRCDRRDA